jgi:hypothetical protein
MMLLGKVLEELATVLLEELELSTCSHVLSKKVFSRVAWHLLEDEKHLFNRSILYIPDNEYGFFAREKLRKVLRSR